MKHKSHLKPQHAIYSLLVAASFAVATPPAQAQSLREDIGASERIGAATEIGLISVRSATAACNINAGIAADHAQTVLKDNAARFDLLEDALKFGNPDLGVIGEETRLQILQALASLREDWDDFKGVAAQVDVAAQDVDLVGALIRADGQVRQDATVLFTETSASYADSILLLQPDAFRLQMLANAQLSAARISRNSCAISSGLENRRVEDELADRIGQFESALNGLATGLDALGIQPPPTPEISSNVYAIIALWQPQREKVARIIAGDALDDESRGQLFVSMDEIDTKLHDLTALYVASSKLN